MQSFVALPETCLAPSFRAAPERHNFAWISVERGVSKVQIEVQHNATQSKISSWKKYIVFFCFCFTCISDLMLELARWQCYVWSKESSPDWNVSLYRSSDMFNFCHRIGPSSSITAEPLTEVSPWCWKHQCSHYEARCLTKHSGRHKPLESRFILLSSLS